MSNQASLHAVVSGYVQGVFFRASVVEIASKLDLKGFVRNLTSGIEIEVEAEGDRDQLRRLLDFLHTGPPGAKVEKVISNWGKHKSKYRTFKILY
jgi:acylphosphatase